MTTEPEGEHRRGGIREAVSELFGRGERAEADRRDDVGRDEAGYAEDSAAPRHGYGDGGGRQGDLDPAQQTGARYEGTSPTTGNAPAGYGESASTGGAEHTPPLGEPLAQGKHPSEPRSPHGGEVRGDTGAPEYLGEGGELRGDTAAPEYVGEGGDPTARAQVQHGGELRGDPGVPHEVGDPRSTTAADESYRDSGMAAGTGGSAGSGEGMRAGGAGAAMAAAAGAAHRDVAAGTAQPDAATGSTSQQYGGDAAVGGTAPTAGSGGYSAGAGGSGSDGSERPPALVTRDRAESYGARWNSVKGAFVDEPRRAVADADALVGELLDELQELFTQQRREIEHGLDRDETSTEDLRIALRRYRSFFDRLLSI